MNLNIFLFAKYPLWKKSFTLRPLRLCGVSKQFSAPFNNSPKSGFLFLSLIEYVFYYKDAAGENLTLVLAYYTDTQTVKLKNTDIIWEKPNDEKSDDQNF